MTAAPVCCRRCGMQGRDIGSDGVQRCTYCGIAHPDIDMVAYGQRIMDLVDQYHEKPNQHTRHAIRAAIMDGLTPEPPRPAPCNCNEKEPRRALGRIKNGA